MRFVHESPGSRVVFGVGRRSEVADELDRLGVRRPLLVAGKESAAGRELADLLVGRLAGVFDEVVMHVPVAVAARAVEAARAADADGVVVVGGGSAIGTAKAVAKETRLPVVAVPTTYAGSEMTPIWGLTEERLKTTGRDPSVLPRVVVYDPELAVSLPAGLSAASGMNALAHLVEGLYAQQVSPLAVVTAREGIRALASGLPEVVARPTDLDARAAVAYGAWLAGWTLGTTGMGLHHKVCHVLGGTFDLPHAPVHSAVLPYAVAANADAAAPAMAEVVAAFGDAGTEADHAAGGVWDLRHRIGATAALADLGFTDGDVDTAAGLVVDGGPVNPRPVDRGCVAAVLRAALRGERPPAYLP